MASDLLQVGLTDVANEKLRRIKEATVYFKEESDIYRMAVAVALALDLPVTEDISASDFKTKYRVFMDTEEERANHSLVSSVQTNHSEK